MENKNIRQQVIDCLRRLFYLYSRGGYRSGPPIWCLISCLTGSYGGCTIPADVHHCTVGFCTVCHHADSRSTVRYRVVAVSNELYRGQLQSFSRFRIGQLGPSRLTKNHIDNRSRCIPEWIHLARCRYCL